MSNSSGAPTRADHPGRIAPITALSAADVQAHDAASYVRPFLSSAGQEALRRSYAATQRWQDEQYDAALVERGLDEYRAWVDGQVAA